MALNIKNSTTVALVRELAEKTGQTQTSAIEQAVRAQLERLAIDNHQRTSDERYQRAMKIVEEIHASMTAEDRAAIRQAQEDMYDEHGLFA